MINFKEYLNGFTLVEVLIVILILAILSIAISGPLGYGVSQEKTISTLTSAGFTDIKPGEYSWFSCSRGDYYQTAFTAKNQLGATISGTVCCGLVFKGCTIRF